MGVFEQYIITRWDGALNLQLINRNNFLAKMIFMLVLIARIVILGTSKRAQFQWQLGLC
jgi:hypothetical protein